MRRFALLLLVAPLALAACGGSSSPQVRADPVAYVKHSAQKTVDMPSEHMTMSATISAGALNLSMTGAGDFANATKQGQLSANASVAGQNVHVEEVLDGTTIYVQSPMFSSMLPGGKSWLKLDLSKIAASQANHMKLLTSLTSQSPAQALQQLLAAGSVTTIGTETIDGVETTHYQVTNLDLSKLPQGAKLEALAHPKYGPIDVWIGNKDGYVYRESLSFTYSISGQSASMSMRVDLSNFGEKVSVTLPPASAVFDETNLVNGGYGG